MGEGRSRAHNPGGEDTLVVRSNKESQTAKIALSQRGNYNQIDITVAGAYRWRGYYALTDGRLNVVI